MFHDRNSKFGETINSAVSDVNLNPVKTSFRSPWQNGVAERWVGSCRRDLLDHVVPLNERHLKCLLSEYVRYYHSDRTHMGLNKDTPKPRARAEQKCGSRILSFPRLGGVHHRYDGAAIASILNSAFRVWESPVRKRFSCDFGASAAS